MMLANVAETYRYCTVTLASVTGSWNRTHTTAGTNHETKQAGLGTFIKSKLTSVFCVYRVSVGIGVELLQAVNQQNRPLVVCISINSTLFTPGQNVWLLEEFNGYKDIVLFFWANKNDRQMSSLLNLLITRSHIHSIFRKPQIRSHVFFFFCHLPWLSVHS